MLDVDEGGQPATPLGLGDDGQREGGFARGLGAVDLDNTAPRYPTHPERAVDHDVAGRNDVDGGLRMVAEAHDGAVAVILRDLLEGEIEVLVTLGGRFVGREFGFQFGGFGRHGNGFF